MGRWRNCEESEGVAAGIYDVQDIPTRSAIPRVEARWKPPGAGLFKINFKGAVFADRSLAGLGIVIRDEFGLIIVTLS